MNQIGADSRSTYMLAVDSNPPGRGNATSAPTTAMHSFQTSGVPVQGPKNYVFVDEHNRHKRLKVMRACEGCRRRKIKCDAATTNSWPCAACKRLKLTCVPPVGGADGEIYGGLNHNAENLPQSSASLVQPPDMGSTHHQYMSQYQTEPRPRDQSLPHLEPYVPPSEDMYHASDYAYSSIPHNDFHPATTNQDIYAQRLDSFDSNSGSNGVPEASPTSTETPTAEDLAENLGELKIDHSGIAPYIRQQNRTTREPPAPIQDDLEDLPALVTAAGSQIRIPPDLMPTDEEALSAFQAFFEHVHPYVPVLCRGHFYQQWHQDRSAISPLLLEAVLACAGQVSDDPADGSQWLALANRHEESFLDSPRLSTVQALFLLLKARERTPKRGYYYRSWMTVKKIVSMAKDLELHEHYDIHQGGESCGASPPECLMKTRVWQLALVCEIMVGAPQGRSDFGVDMATVELSPTPPAANLNEFEQRTSRQFAYWLRLVRNIRAMTEAYHKLKKNPDFGLDPQFVAYNEDFRQWPTDLPAELQLHLPSDGSQPKVASHFIANMNSHYRLGIVMLYRPQLAASKNFTKDTRWKKNMSLCYDSAKYICRVQEAIFDQFGITGLAVMQRGLSFPIYAILTCTMVHLIAVTSPDPEFNHDAREFFTRHMRLLEKCIAEWPMLEVEAQINALRLAFSDNIDKPFELRASFPYGTPSEHSRSPQASRRPSEQTTVHNNHSDQQMYPPQLPHESYFPTPPMSDSSRTNPQTPQVYQNYNLDQNPTSYPRFTPTSHPQNGVISPDQWNPVPIIDQFSAAFAIPPSELGPPSASSGYGSSPTLSIGQQGMPHSMSASSFGPSPTSQGYKGNPFTPPGSDPQLALHHPHQHQHQNQHQHQHQSFVSPPARHLDHHGAQQYYDPAVSPPVNAHYPMVHHSQQQTHHRNQMPRVLSHAGGAGAYDNRVRPNSSTAPPQAPVMATGMSQPVFVTPKEWQESVASVLDPNGGLKRKWQFER